MTERYAVFIRFGPRVCGRRGPARAYGPGGFARRRGPHLDQALAHPDDDDVKRFLDLRGRRHQQVEKRRHGDGDPEHPVGNSTSYSMDVRTIYRDSDSLVGRIHGGQETAGHLGDQVSAKERHLDGDERSQRPIDL